MSSFSFFHQIYPLWVLNVFVVFFKAYQTLPLYQNCPTAQPAKPGKYYQQKPHNFNKTAACSHHCPLWHEHCHWGIGIAGYIVRLIGQPQSKGEISQKIKMMK